VAGSRQRSLLAAELGSGTSPWRSRQSGFPSIHPAVLHVNSWNHGEALPTATSTGKTQRDRAQVDAGERKGSRWLQQCLGQDFKIAKLLMNFILTEIPTLNSGHSYEAGCPTKEKSIRASPPALPAERDRGDAAWQLSAGRVSAPNHC